MPEKCACRCATAAEARNILRICKFTFFVQKICLNDILNVFRGGKAKESEGTLRRHAKLIMQRADVDGDGSYA